MSLEQVNIRKSICRTYILLVLKQRAYSPELESRVWFRVWHDVYSYLANKVADKESEELKSVLIGFLEEGVRFYGKFCKKLSQHEETKEGKELHALFLIRQGDMYRYLTQKGEERKDRARECYERSLELWPEQGR